MTSNNVHASSSTLTDSPLRFPPISPKCPHFWHGGDYNPDQWRDSPEIFEEDLRLMKLAGCNVFSLGIFSWITYEPKEGEYNFDWMEMVLTRLHQEGIFVVLATPSGSKPAWMSEKYPEVCRVTEKGRREPHRRRHNHCRTSPVYRQKCQEINTRLAKRFGHHPAVILWHVSNEYNGGDCHCPLCYEAFRTWLKERYNHDLNALNKAWWTGFWSHTFTEWEQIKPLDTSIHGLLIDWKRFQNDQTIDFFKQECIPLREHAPHIPITTNFMGFLVNMNYWKFAKEVDVISWDSYPAYHDRPNDWLNAVTTSFLHDMNRSFKQKPFILMESTPSVQNWQPVNKLKRPGVHAAEAMQAVAHGSDTVMYFQWRKSRGGFEKFHGAVVDHCGHEHNRVFRDVAAVGRSLSQLDAVIGTTSPAKVAILYDWENRWAIDEISGLSKENLKYQEICVEHYRSFWSAGVACDIINLDSELDKYDLVIAPLLYMIRPNFSERIYAFVEAGGTFVTTYLSGMVDESDLCFLNGFPGPLRDLLGIWAEETDSLYSQEQVKISTTPLGIQTGLHENYEAGEFCDLLHLEGAEMLANYDSEFYKGSPAVTRNAYGKGKAYYIGSRFQPKFYTNFYRHLIDTLHLPRALSQELPAGVTAQIRRDENREFIFLINFSRENVIIPLQGKTYRDTLSHEILSDKLNLSSYKYRILETI